MFDGHRRTTAITELWHVEREKIVSQPEVVTELLCGSAAVSLFFLREPVQERVPCTGSFSMMEDNVCVFKGGWSKRSWMGLYFFPVYLLNSFSSPHLECVGRVLLGGVVGGTGDEEWPFMLPLCQFYFVVVAEGDEKFVDVSGGASAGQKFNKKGIRLALEFLCRMWYVFDVSTLFA